MTKYDAIFLGSGQAANPLAKKLAAAGWRTALIERKWVGGTCINVGCTPTKTLIASGRVASLLKRSADYGIHAAGFSIDMAEFLSRKNSVVLSYRESITKGLLATPNLDLIFGTAAFSGPKEITVTEEDGSKNILTAENIFINTGASPSITPIPGLSDIDYLTSTSIMDLMEIPAHLAIIGGGYIALEFGQLYRRLGSEVTIIEHGSQFLPKEDDDIAAEIKKILEEDGIRILIGTTVTQVTREGKSIRLDLGNTRRTHPFCPRKFVARNSATRRQHPGTHFHFRLTRPGGHRPQSQYRRTQYRRHGYSSGPARIYRRRRAAANQHTRHLRPGRCQWRPPVHAYLIQ